MLNDLFPIDWSEFHFLRPLFLWGFVVVGLLFIAGMVSMKEHVRWQKYIAPHLRPYMINRGSIRLRKLIHILMTIGLSLGVLALAGPTWKTIEIPGQVLETPTVILLDLSQSMMATDIQPSRLERSKFKIQDFLDAEPGSRVALIGYAGTAHTIVPLTRDYKIIKSHLEGLSPKVMPVAGTNYEQALHIADTTMQRTKAPGTVLIFTDEFESIQLDLAREFIQKSNGKLVFVPMNTRGGADVPSNYGNAVLRYQGEPVHSSLNSEVVAQLASLERVSVVSMTLDPTDMQLVAHEINQNLTFTEEAEKKEDAWRDAGLVFVIPLAFLLLLMFRRGWVLYGIAFVFLFSSCQDGHKFEDLWYTKDYQGQQLSDQGKFEEAAQVYSDPLRQGVAYYKSGDYDQAIKAFNRDTTAMGAFNLGLAYVKNGDLAAAELAFGLAVQMDPGMEAAKKNQDQLGHLSGGTNEADPKDAQEAGPQGEAQNEQNKSMEDLSGGGQEATEKDMEKKRLEETVATDIRKGKELDEVPDDLESVSPQNNSKILMRKVDDDPSLFLQRKFEYQIKQQKVKPKKSEKPW